MTYARAAIATLVAMLALGGTAMATSTGAQQGASTNGVVGSWMATVSRGPTLPALESLQSFTRGGSVIETANTVGVRGASHGSWVHVRNRLYASTLIFFRFDQGNYIGTQKIRSTMRLSADGSRFTAIAISELRDAAGNVVAANLRATVTGQRIAVERIPDVP